MTSSLRPRLEQAHVLQVKNLSDRTLYRMKQECSITFDSQIHKSHQTGGSLGLASGICILWPGNHLQKDAKSIK